MGIMKRRTSLNLLLGRGLINTTSNTGDIVLWKRAVLRKGWVKSTPWTKPPTRVPTSVLIE